MSLVDLVMTDLARTFEQPLPPTRLRGLRLLVTGLATVKGLALVGFRLSHWAGSKSPKLGSLIKQVTQVLTGADIEWQTRIGPGLRMLHPQGVVITGGAVIGARFTIHGSTTVGSTPEGSPIIGDDVNLAPGSRVFGPVIIRDRVRLGANAVLTKTVDEEDVVLAGIPAEILRRVVDGR